MNVIVSPPCFIREIINNIFCGIIKTNRVNILEVLNIRIKIRADMNIVLGGRIL